MAKQRPKQEHYTVAILDEEATERSRFMKFLKEEFTVVEIPYVTSVDELISKIKESGIEAIAIDYKLKDHNSRFKENGDFFFKNLISQLEDFPAFVLTKDAEKAKKESKLINPRFIISKDVLYPKLSSDDEKKVFKDNIRFEIESHKAIIQEKTKRLNTLQKLKQAKKLTAILENEYIELNNQISKMVTGSEIPMKYFSSDTNKKLDEIISKTDSLIAKIDRKKK